MSLPPYLSGSSNSKPNDNNYGTPSYMNFSSTSQIHNAVSSPQVTPPSYLTQHTNPIAPLYVQSQPQITRHKHNETQSKNTGMPSYLNLSSDNREPQQFPNTNFQSQPISPYTMNYNQQTTSFQPNINEDEEEIRIQRQTLEAFGFSIVNEKNFERKPRKADVHELSELLLDVQQDPRYSRLIFKYAPSVHINLMKKVKFY